MHLKFENLQFTASFKERGALNKLLSLSDDEKKRGVAAMSAGNHAQGVAYHGGRLGIPVTIVMPEGTPFTKVKHTKDFGARVTLQGATLSESYARATEIAKDEGLTFVHPYDDPAVIAGQGTVALEMLADAEQPLDTLVVPIGGGGLISGIAIAAKAINPAIEIIGVQSRAYPSMYDVFKSANLPAAGQTIAEGIAVKEPGELTRTYRARPCERHPPRRRKPDRAGARRPSRDREDRGRRCRRRGLCRRRRAQGPLRRTERRHRPLRRQYRHAPAVQRHPARTLARGPHPVPRSRDRGPPGPLARIASLVGEAGGNILEVSHNRMMTDTPVKSAYLGMVVEARDATHAEEIRACLRDAGFTLRTPTVNITATGPGIRGHPGEAEYR